MKIVHFALVIGFTTATACGRFHPATSEQDSIVGLLGRDAIDPEIPTHIIAVGYSNGQGNQFVAAATTRARRFLDLNPNHQVVIFASPEVGFMDDVAAVRQHGIKVLSDDNTDHLSGTRLVNKMLAFAQIESFDFYGHSSPWAIALEDNQSRLSFSTTDLAVLRNNFTSRAFATLNGCNSGMFLAPHLARIWKIPVSGAVAGSNFQRLHNDGTWYTNDVGYFPASGGWASHNSVSFANDVPCSRGACMRMKPENTPYRGYWGAFDSYGLGFYKFFCPGQNQQQCEENMARSLLAFPSLHALTPASSTDDFVRVAADYLCPNGPTVTTLAQCTERLREAVADTNVRYNPFGGRALSCTLRGCDVSLQCDYDAQGSAIPGSCNIRSTENGDHTLMQEFHHYRNGFQRLANQAPRADSQPQ